MSRAKQVSLATFESEVLTKRLNRMQMAGRIRLYTGYHSSRNSNAEEGTEMCGQIRK